MAGADAVGRGEALPHRETAVGGLRRVRAALRSRALVLGEVLAIAAACALYTLVPQVGAAGVPERVRFAAEHPWAAPLLRALRLDAVLHAGWFTAVVGLSAVTLSIVLWDQWRRAARLFRQRPGPESFAGAPYRRVVPRPSAAAGDEVRIRTRGRVAVFGTPVFHTGLLLVVIAGLVRAVAGQDATVYVIEGEGLDTSVEAWGRNFGGPLSAPLRLERPVHLGRLHQRRYASGRLEALWADVAVLGEGGPREARLGINEPLDVGNVRMYLTAMHGLAAELRVEGAQGASAAWSVVEPAREDGSGDATAGFPGGLEVVVRGRLGLDGGLPAGLEVRVLRGAALLYAGALPLRSPVALPGGGRITLGDLRYWCEVRGSRDAALWLAYLGFALVLLGAVAIFTLNRVDTAVFPEPGGAGDRAVVALRAYRFAPLYAERFERLVREVEESGR